MTLTKRIKQFEKIVQDNSPTILTGVAVAGTVTTAILSGRASFKAADLIWEAENDPATPKLPLDLKAKFKLVGTLYIPAAGVCTLTIGSIIMANRIGNRRAAALAAAYALSEKAMTEYKDKVIDRIGETKEQAIRDEIAQDQVAQTPGSNSVVLIGNGDILCFDAYSGRYFQSRVETIKKAENELNHQILNDMYASLTDWYTLLGLPRIEVSDEVGWNVDKLLEIKLTSVLSEDDRPCLSVNFNVTPVRGYYKMH
jgi:hypothetical protein